MARHLENGHVGAFDYTSLETDAAHQAQDCAERIRARVRKALEDVIAIGKDLLAIKEALPHGRFLPWVSDEFGWSERTARNFMSVAEWFGPKSAMIADLTIAPTAAYLLAGPSVPEQARVAAIERAEAGESITPVVAKEIMAQVRKKGAKKLRRVAANLLAPKLLMTLQRYHQRWETKEIAELAKQLREFADKVEKKREEVRKKRED